MLTPARIVRIERRPPLPADDLANVAAGNFQFEEGSATLLPRLHRDTFGLIHEGVSNLQ